MLQVACAFVGSTARLISDILTSHLDRLGARDGNAWLPFALVPCASNAGNCTVNDTELAVTLDELPPAAVQAQLRRIVARVEGLQGTLRDATPGEMVARIENFLGDDRRMTTRAAEEGSASPPDASAALHAALANIRASLR